jgi:uncharacterized protein (DUF302 family)
MKERAMDNEPVAVDYALVPAPAFHTVVTSRLDFEATVASLKQEIAARDLWLIAEINPRALLERGGYAMRSTRQLLFFHPRYMARLLAADPNALIEAPLKLVIMEMPDGAVTVRQPDVRAQLSRYVGTREIADELTRLSTGLLRSVEKGGAAASG